MKKTFLALFAILMLSAMNAQTGLGVKGGLLLGMSKAKTPSMNIEGINLGGGEYSDTNTGFYVGVFKGFPVGDGIEIEPGVNAVIDDGEFGIQIPIMAKYYVAQGLNLQAGPQLLFGFEESPDDFTNLNLGLALGVGYDINENFLAEIRYGLQLNNHYTGDLDDFSLKNNTLNLGVGYKF